MSHAADFATERSGGHRPLISRAAYLFSMFASLIVHGTLLLLLMLFFSGGGGSGGNGAAGTGGGDFLEVGFSTKRGGGSESQAQASAALTEFPSEPSLPTFNSLPTGVVDDRPPVALSTPNPNSRVPVVGTAPPRSASTAPAFAGVPRSVSKFRPSKGSGTGFGDGTGSGNGDGTGSGGGAGDGSGTGTGSGVGPGSGPGITTFFNIRDKGGRFVYVLDRSVSMAGYNAIRVAKTELLKSLEGLNPEQQFQIVFYNDKPISLEIGNNGGKGLLRASGINRSLAGQFIAGVQPESSTEHILALEMGLSFHPDVLFLLTDAGPPQLNAAEMAKIRKLNAGRTRIHCVEFHQGRKLAKEVSFLEKLALENGGGYRFFDITEEPSSFVPRESQ